MKWFTALMFILCLTVKVLPQSDDIGFKCGFVSDTSSFSNNTPVTIPQNLKITILLCAEPGLDDVVLLNEFISKFKQNFDSYFRIATNNKRNISISEILVNHISGDTAHVLKLAGNLAYDPIVGQPDFVLSPALTNQLLAKADSLYDFSQFDADNDGIVDFLAIMIIRHTSLHNGGTIGLSTNAFYETNDYSANGSRIRIDGTQYSRAIIQKLNCPSNYSTKLLSLTIHELGHSLFGFGDTDHYLDIYYNHYALGGFCAMSDGQFRNVASY